MPTINIPTLAERNKIGDPAYPLYPLNGTYLQTADIDATAGITVIGTGTGVLRFAGIYNGGNFRTLNVTINTPLVDYVGLFGSTVGATITGIADVTGTIVGKDNVGGVIGRAVSGAVTSCICSAAITGVTYTGGMIGYCSDSFTISNSSTSSTVMGGSGGNTGGLVGRCYSSSVSTSFSTGAVIGGAGTGIGGLIGVHQVSSTTSNCYATGAVAGAISVGGLIGISINTCATVNCRAAGSVTGGVGGYGIGGLIGTRSTSATASCCFATGAVSTGAGGYYCGLFIGNDGTRLLGSVGAIIDADAKIYLFYKAAAWNFATWWQPIAMPNIVGQTVKAAAELLCAVGCTIGTETEQYDLTVPAGQIITQSIAAGGTAGYPQLQAFGGMTSPKTGDVVNVTVSLGNSVPVPGVIGIAQATAESRLAAAYFTATVQTATDEHVQAGLVSAQSPAGGTSATYQSSVTITVSTGRANTEVPGVLGLTTANATSAITAAGLVAANTTETNEDIPAGLVFEQLPAASVTVVRGSTVAIVTSDGPTPISVPDVTGLTQADAESAITGAGLVPVVRTDYSFEVIAGAVIIQAPAAEAVAKAGDAVAVIVSLGYDVDHGGGVMEMLDGFKTALSFSSAFKVWAGVSTTPAAAARIHNWEAVQDGDPVVAIAPGSGFSCEVVTLDQGFLVTPVITCEFSQAVEKSETSEAVFNSCATAVDAIMAEVKAMTGWRIKGWQLDSSQTPARTKASAGVNFIYYRVTVFGDQD